MKDPVETLLLVIVIGMLVAVLWQASVHIEAHNEHMREHEQMRQLLEVLPAMMNAVTEKLDTEMRQRREDQATDKRNKEKL